MTIDVLEQYVEALGGQLEVSVVQGRRRTALLGPHVPKRSTASKSVVKRTAAAKSTSRRSA